MNGIPIVTDLQRFAGDPAPNTATAAAESNPSFIEQVKLKAAETAKSFLIDMWLARHTEEKVMPVLRSVIDGAKDEFADAVANGGGIYAVGYCFGAKYVMLLAGGGLGSTNSKDEEEGKPKDAPLIKAGALAHGESRISLNPDVALHRRLHGLSAPSVSFHLFVDVT